MSTGAQHASRVTVDDLFAIDDDKRYELFDGRLCVVPPPGMTHQLALTGLLHALLVHVREHDLGVLVPGPIGLILGKHDYVEPDIAYVSKEHRDRFSERGFEQPPDLVVEVVSPSPGSRRRDTMTKLRRYERAGVPHYWVVDPRARTVVAYELRTGRYEIVESHAAADTFRPRLFPGLEIPLREIWPPDLRP